MITHPKQVRPSSTPPSTLTLTRTSYLSPSHIALCLLREFPGAAVEFPGEIRDVPGAAHDGPRAVYDVPGTAHDVRGAAVYFPGGTHNIPGASPDAHEALCSWGS